MLSVVNETSDILGNFFSLFNAWNLKVVVL